MVIFTHNFKKFHNFNIMKSGNLAIIDLLDSYLKIIIERFSYGQSNTAFFICRELL